MHHLFLGISPGITGTCSLILRAISQGLTLKAEQIRGFISIRKAQLMHASGYCRICRRRYLWLYSDAQAGSAGSRDQPDDQILVPMVRWFLETETGLPAVPQRQDRHSKVPRSNAECAVQLRRSRSCRIQRWQLGLIQQWEMQHLTGLCGSGLIDLVAQLYKAGLIDEGGHLESGQETPGCLCACSAGRSGQ